MEKLFETIILDARKLPGVPVGSVLSYKNKIPEMKQDVNERIAANDRLQELIGNNPIQVLYDNHTHHATFMLAVFNLRNYELLARTMLWVYRAYSAHGFSYDYFPLELNCWIEAIDAHLDSDKTEEIKIVYEWMLDHHREMVELSRNDYELKLSVDDSWLEKKNSFLAAVIAGDHRRCLKIAENASSSREDIEKLYLQVIQPAMYEVGNLWERGLISVAQEHLASAIVTRVMASMDTMDFDSPLKPCKAIVTTAPNEFHELGAWIISDVLMNEGWNVRYLGADTPSGDLLEMVKVFQPHMLAMSVTMPFNLNETKEIISMIKKDNGLKSTKIVVGGLVFNNIERLWESIGADYFAKGIDDFKQFLSLCEK